MPTRIIVVGAGVIGLLTALECARAGAGVDLVDRSAIPSPSATSNDVHRVVRAFHRGDQALTSAAAVALERWLDVERRIGTRFYHRTGALTVLPAEEVPDAVASLTASGGSAGGRAEDALLLGLSPEELSTRYSRIRFPARTGAVLEPGAGTVLAGRALLELAAHLRNRPGVRLHPHRRVVSVDDAAGAVRLDDGTVLAGDGVVIAAGPWSRDLVPAALADDLVLYRQSVLSYVPASFREAWAGMPAVPSLGVASGAWLTPPVDGTPVRLSAASACRPVAERTDQVTPRQWRDHLIDRFAALLTEFDPAAVTGATDGYYLAAASTGDGPLLTELGDSPVWVYAACGGLSFKFAPVIAAALADRAMGRPPRRSGLDPVDRPRRFGAVRPAGPA